MDPLVVQIDSVGGFDGSYEIVNDSSVHPVVSFLDFRLVVTDQKALVFWVHARVNHVAHPK